MAAALFFAVAGAAGCDRLLEGREARVTAQELQAAATDPRVKAFYELRGWRAAWSRDSERDLLEALEGAVAHGLAPQTFVEIIHSAEGDAARDAELTLAALTYAHALAVGVVEPAKVHSIYTLARPDAEVPAELGQALDENRLAAWLNGLAPQDDEYRALSQAYVAYHARADEEAKAPIPPGATIRVGDADPRIPAIAQRLVAGGYLALPEGSVVGEAFSREMSDALRLMQRDSRVAGSGVVDDRAIAILNQAAADRARQLAVNLERRRWLSRDPPATRIDVTTAASEMVYYRAGQSAWTGRTVVGAPVDPTPALGETFRQLVVNPPWNVPEGIARTEILPRGPSYLAANNMYVENGRVIQRAGPGAALGQVKFDMQNRYAIYLHDTPAKAQFQSDERHRSHGCVRVENAVEFARFLAAEHGKAEEFDAALQSGGTRTVQLGADIPVRLLYHTAYLSPEGRVIFADDPYRWDDRLGSEMGLGPAIRTGEPQAVAVLLGP